MQDINYIRINTPELWQRFRLHSENCVFSDGLRLNSSNIYIFREHIIQSASLDIADIAVDECDTVYFIDSGKDSFFSYDRTSGAINECGCRKGTLPVRLSSPSGIGIDRDSIYIADFNATENTSRIIALARSNLQIRWICSCGTDGNPLSEINDLAIGFDGHIYALEKDGKQALRLERSGRITGCLKRPDIADPTDLAVDDKGGVYVLDGRKVFVFEPDGSSKMVRTDIDLRGISVSRDGHIFAGEPGPFHLKKTIHMIMPDGVTIPLWSYRGAVRRLINDSKGNLYIVDDKGDGIAFLEYANINTKNKEDLYKGVFVSKPLDSRDDKNRWHRIFIKGDFIKGTQAEFSYFISNTLVPDSELMSMPEDKWKFCFADTAVLQGENKRDALFLEDIQGRYLWFRLSLFGDEKMTPVIKTLTVFFPRITWLDYLPAVYQENPGTMDFLERFLSIFESLTYETDFEIEHLTHLFDAEGAPYEFLSWFGLWLSFSVDGNWPEAKTRAFIKKAVYFYKMRGTRRGLQEMLDFFTGDKTYIVENFGTAAASAGTCEKAINKTHSADSIFLPPDKATAKTSDDKEVPLLEVLYGKERFCFCVLLSASGLEAYKPETIKRIIDEQKPAHTCYGLKTLEPWFYLDMHTYLGINTCLTEPVFVLGKSSVIGRDTKLHDNEEAGQISRRARAGIDTKLT